MLTDAKIRNAKSNTKPIKLTDSGGLHLEIRPTGAKLWRYRYRIAGKENTFAIGEYFNDKHAGHVSLSDARSERDRARVLVKQGIHPSHNRQSVRIARQSENANTFEAVAREWLIKKAEGWTATYLRQVQRSLNADVFPFIGSLPIRNVTAAHLLEIVRRVERRGAETVALLIRQWCSAIFQYGASTLRCDSDPTTALRRAIHRPKVEHSKPLSREQLTAFVGALDSYSGHRTTAIALHLMLLTFVRTVELRAARWDEFDLDRSEWRIPTERMKMRIPHLVPLSQQAMELLRELHTYTGQCEFLFPNYRRPQSFMAATTLNRALERIGFNDFSAHGFRSTASTTLNEMGFRFDVIEKQLAHQPRDRVRAAYNTAEYLPERKTMMQQWADYLDGLLSGSNVIALRTA